MLRLPAQSVNLSFRPPLVLTEGNLFRLLRSHFLYQRCEAQTEILLTNFFSPTDEDSFLLLCSVHDATLIFTQDQHTRTVPTWIHPVFFSRLVFSSTLRCVRLSGSRTLPRPARLASQAILYRHRGFTFPTRGRKCLVNFSTSWPITKRTQPHGWLTDVYVQ